MSDYFNPFEYDAAHRLGEDRLIDFYIEDYNYSRFIKSHRNVFLQGERGTGKSMALLYNSFPIQSRKAKREETEVPLDTICVYIPCNTPLTHRREYELLDEFRSSVISEHFLVLSIMHATVETISHAVITMAPQLIESMKDETRYSLGLEIAGNEFFPTFLAAISGISLETQRALNDSNPDAFYEKTFSFSSGILPLLTLLRRIPELASTHYSLMIDDAHNLNPEQIGVLNSWIAYRDNSLFSFKVATAKVSRPIFITSSGGNILEGHDYTLVDMEQPYQNKFSDFGKLARDVIQRRLDVVKVHRTPDDYFPINPDFQKDLHQCEDQVRDEAIKKYGDDDSKKVADYVYKNARARYFRNRAAKANRPPYSGFELLVHLSTGVVRNLLEPCYWMYDRVYSDKKTQADQSPVVDVIPPSIQTETILDRSSRKWSWMHKELDRSIQNCSRAQALMLAQLFENLATHFHERLLHHKSEPRAIAFTVSDLKYSKLSAVLELLDLAQEAQLLYTYRSSAKESGRREVYYVPNRILWPDRGLDPVGQHARVSIMARHLWAAANDNRKIPIAPERQPSLLDDQD